MDNLKITAQELRFASYMKDKKIAQEYNRIKRNIQARVEKGYDFTMLSSEVDGAQRYKVITLLKDEGFIVETQREWFDCPIEYFISWGERRDEFLEWQVKTLVKNFDILEEVLNRLDNTLGRPFIDMLNQPKKDYDDLEDEEDDE